MPYTSTAMTTAATPKRYPVVTDNEVPLPGLGGVEVAVAEKPDRGGTEIEGRVRGGMLILGEEVAMSSKSGTETLGSESSEVVRVDLGLSVVLVLVRVEVRVEVRLVVVVSSSSSLPPLEPPPLPPPELEPEQVRPFVQHPEIGRQYRPASQYLPVPRLQQVPSLGMQ